ncbi:hypothetical protein DY000_02024849 [Brassica cretica]|uniref:Uncharacterized protein n=1 Tax=Brassica cretica TaxID=69181 RepID=A0ABQ7E5R7_BRACR|nr:hypothetical protein DY000_02024849 [Brassica cretica]
MVQQTARVIYRCKHIANHRSVRSPLYTIQLSRTHRYSTLRRSDYDPISPSPQNSVSLRSVFPLSLSGQFSLCLSPTSSVRSDQRSDQAESHNRQTREPVWKKSNRPCSPKIPIKRNVLGGVLPNRQFHNPPGVPSIGYASRNCYGTAPVTGLYYPNDMSNMSIPSDPVPTAGWGCYTQPLLSVESSVSFFKGPVASHMALTSVFSNRKPKPTHENQHLLIARNNVYFKAIKAAWEWNTSQYTEPSNKHKLSINATISNDATLELMQE